MNTTRRRGLQALAALPLLSLTGMARAQTPSKQLRLVVPLTPGTTPDTVARAIGPHLQRKLDAVVVVDNRVGASGMIGMDYVARAEDDSTLMITPSTTLTLPMFYKNVNFDVIKSFAPVTMTVSTSFVLVVSSSVPARTLPEFIAWNKSNPGAFYASPGSGTHHHLCMELFKQATGVEITHVPYKGSAQAISDVVAGQVPTMFMPVQVAAPLAKDGRIRILGGSLRMRHPAYPDIPTLQELGVKDFEVDPWYAVWGPAKLSADATNRYREAIVAALSEADVRAAFDKQGLIVKTSTPAELLQIAQREYAQWDRVIKAANIRPE
ncbi:tripartite tricarboxylate transporter substrate binding protein [soil metagenome]